MTPIYKNQVSELKRIRWVRARDWLVNVLHALGLNGGPGSTYNVERANRIMNLFWRFPRDDR